MTALWTSDREQTPLICTLPCSRSYSAFPYIQGQWKHQISTAALHLHGFSPLKQGSSDRDFCILQNTGYSHAVFCSQCWVLPPVHKGSGTQASSSLEYGGPSKRVSIALAGQHWQHLPSPCWEHHGGDANLQKNRHKANLKMSVGIRLTGKMHHSLWFLTTLVLLSKTESMEKGNWEMDNPLLA